MAGMNGNRLKKIGTGIKKFANSGFGKFVTGAAKGLASKYGGSAAGDLVDTIGSTARGETSLKDGFKKGIKEFGQTSVGKKAKDSVKKKLKNGSQMFSNVARGIGGRGKQLAGSQMF